MWKVFDLLSDWGEFMIKDGMLKSLERRFLPMQCIWGQNDQNNDIKSERKRKIWMIGFGDMAEECDPFWAVV